MTTREPVRTGASMALQTVHLLLAAAAAIAIAVAFQA